MPEGRADRGKEMAIQMLNAKTLRYCATCDWVIREDWLKAKALHLEECNWLDCYHMEGKTHCECANN